MQPNGTKTTYAYDAENRITEVRTTCFCGHLISSYTYEYNESGYVSKETAKECLFTSDKDYGHNGGEVSWCAHTDANPCPNQVWETTRTFTYGENGRLTECKIRAALKRLPISIVTNVYQPVHAVRTVTLVSAA